MSREFLHFDFSRRRHGRDKEYFIIKHQKRKRFKISGKNNNHIVINLSVEAHRL